MFWSMEKYFIWYYIANFVMPTKLIISHCSEEKDDVKDLTNAKNIGNTPGNFV